MNKNLCILTLLCGSLLTAPAAAAQSVAIANACGIPVHHAFIEVGKHEPPQVFTPDKNDGRWEFNFLATATEPLTAMCFRTTDKATLFRVPLPEGLTRCHFEDKALACSSESVRVAPVPTEQRSMEGMPSAVAQAFLAWRKACGDTAEAVFSDDYLTVVDIDHDGDDDYVLNGDEATCVADGKVVSRSGGNGGTSLTIFTQQAKTVTKALAVFTQSADVRAHKGFATVATADGIYRLTNGKAAKIKSRNGGDVVYSLGR
ncbi:hypothetical protein [Agrobacterium bohemicum]|uniref:Uncharacterized protein n=1 Tax=Agrobacterium bohemicum TaxID=2052828 RepID=A0A135P840_9HYPH|nr:hypothetical protein [Agrobacterium bohemicum]KXG87590.1 hypothetical protein ATO67_18255 [Agrobacterium bohemicum]